MYHDQQVRNTKRHVAHFSICSIRQPLYTLQLEWRLIPEQHLRSILYSPPPRIDEFLQEHLPEHTIRLFSEDSTEDDRNPVMARFNVDSLLISVVDRHHFSTLSYTFRRRLARKSRSILLPVGEIIESSFERCSHGIAFEE